VSATRRLTQTHNKGGDGAIYLKKTNAGGNSSGAPSYISASYTVKEAGYAYVFVSNENATTADVYFDDVTMTYTPTNVIQYNEYYPFGLQAATSWTRINNAGNNYLGNGGTELNGTTGVYDLMYRNYDPALGRMSQSDPMADSYASHTPYNYSFNDPVYWSDPSGAVPCTMCSDNGGVTQNTQEGGGSGGVVMINGQPLTMRDPFGNTYYTGGALGHDMYSSGGSWTESAVTSSFEGFNTKGDAYTYTYTRKVSTFVSNAQQGGLQQQYQDLINNSKYSDAVSLLINAYSLDNNAKGLYNVNIVNNDAATYFTTGGAMGGKQTIDITTGVLKKTSFGVVVRSIYHELIHVNQRAVLEIADHNEREFLAYYNGSLNAPWYFPAADQANINLWTSKAMQYYNNLSPGNQIKYFSNYINLTGH
jgi:RHS repeat-associated protein